MGRFAIAVSCALFTSTACTQDAGTPRPPNEPINSDLALHTNGGGCFPTDESDRSLEQIVLVNPEWAPVVEGHAVESDPVLVHGTVLWAHGDTGGDFPATHMSSDYNAAIELDPEERFRLATGNVGENDAHPTLELEWEVDMVPAWAWADAGDRIVALGRWIFDCGHPDLRPRHCVTSTVTECDDDADCGNGDACDRQHFGYSSELHPPHATAVLKSGRGAVLSDEQPSPVPVTEVNIFVSGNGGAAADACVIAHQDLDSDLIFKTSCYPLAQPLAKINAEDFVFAIPLGPKPEAKNARARWRFVPRETPADAIVAAFEVIDQSSIIISAEPQLEVRVKMTSPVGGKNPTAFAGTLYAGWDVPPTSPMSRVRVHLTGVKILDAKRPASPIVREVKTWHMQVAVNGEWQSITNLDEVEESQDFAEDLTWDLFLPRDGILHFVANGTSRACIDTLFGHALNTVIAELGIDDAVSCLLTEAKNPGVIDESYAGPIFGAGPGIATYETATDAYVLRYTIERF